MAKRMLVDATQPEETRVVVVNGNRLEELDFEIASKKQLKGNIYLAKVTRVEPSLQAAFIEYGGNRHGFLAFSEIHPDYYRIPVEDREALLAEAQRYAEEAEEADDDFPPPHHHESDTGHESGDATPLAVAGEAGASRGSDEEDPTAESVPEEPSSRLESADETQDDGAPADEPRDSIEARTLAEAIPMDSVSEDGPAGESPSDPAPPDEAPSDEAPSDEPGPEAAAEAAGEPDELPVNLDIVGGDEVEDIARRRPRPLRSYKIQEVIKRRQILLVQVTKEERGTKGAALTTYLSLPGRYCVLMPNTVRGGGVSRKITNPQDRKRLKEILSDLDVPKGMAVILRTAGMERSKAEIKRDLEYLLRLWDSIREQTFKSIAPELIYEEANLIKRSIRDLYTNDIDEVQVEGEGGYRVAKDFMRMLVPSHSKRVQLYQDQEIPLFFRYQVETQIDAIHSPVVQLRSGGYIVINPTEALVAIDVNSGRSTRERNIEETAYKTNLEAAEEIARQLRLRDLAGLIVIDFIDMEDSRNNASVERRLKEAMKTDRARIQLGRISPFGLLELSRQRMRPSLTETNFEKCPHCTGAGIIRSIESAALHSLRAIEEEGIRRRSAEITVALAPKVTLYILNFKRIELARIEARYGLRVLLYADESLIIPELRIERTRTRVPGDDFVPVVSTERIHAESARGIAGADEDDDADEGRRDSPPLVEPTPPPARISGTGPQPTTEFSMEDPRDRNGRRGRRGRRRSGTFDTTFPPPVSEPVRPAVEAGSATEGLEDGVEPVIGTEPQPAIASAEAQLRKRRRGKRGGRRRGRGRFEQGGEGLESAAAVDAINGEPADDDGDGELVDGELVDGELVDREQVDREQVAGELVAGELVDGELIEDVTIEGAPTKSEALPIEDAPVTNILLLTNPLAPLAVEIQTSDDVEFDWGLDSERPVPPPPVATPALPVAEIAIKAAVVEKPENVALDDGVEVIVASTEGDGLALEPVPMAEEAPEPGTRKRTTRRRPPVEGSGAPEAPPPARRPRRRTKAATAEADSPIEITTEISADLAGEIMPEPVTEAESLAQTSADETAGDSADFAPTEQPAEIPPLPPVIVVDAPLPAPTGESTVNAEIPPVEAEARPARRGWWSKG
ncbi:MAG: Rne/Rng family ribonuclease [Rhodospirillaceae bacterium]